MVEFLYFFLLDSLMAVCGSCVLTVQSREPLSGSESLFKAANS